MIKRILYIALGAAVSILTACTESPIDPTLQVSGSSRSYIFFEPSVVNIVETKTEMLQVKTLPKDGGTAFGVFGYAGTDQLFDNERVFRSTDDALFSYVDLVAWKDDSTVHDFYAYYPYDIAEKPNIGATVSKNTDGLPYITYTQPTDQQYMVDILTATLSTAKRPVVTLEFNHRLWALDITVKNNRTSDDMVYDPSDGKNDISKGHDVKLKKLKFEIKDIPASGTLYMDGSIEVSDQTISFSEEYTPNITIEPSKMFTVNGQNSFLLLPCESLGFRVTAEFENTWGLTYTAHYPTTYLVDETTGEPALDANDQIQWEWETVNKSFAAGNRYTIEINKSDYEVTYKWVQADWGEWDEENQEWIVTDVTHTFN